MICPQCETAGERSRVFPGEITLTDEKVQQHWDEDGNYVEDNPNILTKAFSCSNGHNWRAHKLRAQTTIENLASS